uniref:C-type lectin domain-containing protein n=1 Tax=Amphiprion ocellaris TaxID=80972 RepID=A0A3Q1CQE1_AMPOC
MRTDSAAALLIKLSIIFLINQLIVWCIKCSEMVKKSQCVPKRLPPQFAVLFHLTHEFSKAKCNFPIVTGLCILPSCSAQFYHIVTAAMTWTDAQSYCREKYTDLVTINSMEDMVRLRDQLGGKDDDQFWIGLYGDLDNWKWSLEKERNEEGQAEYSVWYPGQPNMYSDVLCCTLIDNSGQFNHLVLMPNSEQYVN